MLKTKLIKMIRKTRPTKTISKIKITILTKVKIISIKKNMLPKNSLALFAIK